MRIVGGAWRGRRLAAPAGHGVRPTSDRAREALFNILENGPAFAELDIAGAVVVDAFAGTGALGLEALSRGAALALFLETDADALVVLRQNLDSLGARERARAYPLDATQPGRAPEACDLALLDPPYGAELAGPALTALAAGGWLGPGAAVVVELAKGDAFTPPDGFALVDERVYGAARLVFLRSA